MDQQESAFYIAHFNDVYDIEEQPHQPCGGVARFLTVIRMLQTQYGTNLLTLFSGDLFSPSVLSSIYSGSQLVYPFNEFGVDVSCLGNHDFDYSLEELVDLMAQTKGPWLLSNVHNPQTQTNLADALPHYIRDVPLTDGASLKIGFLGLAEEEWLGQITTVPEELIEYEDYVHCANRTCKYLREEEGCQFIIALTHMRIPNDQNLVKNIAPGLIDLVLGGHDHVWHHEKILETLYVKSGTNFRNLSLIRIEFHKMSVVPWVAQVEDLFKQLIASTDVYNCIEEGPSISSIGVLKHAFEFTFKRFQATLVPINVTHQIPANQTMELYVAEKVAKYNSESLRTIGFSDVDLDTTFKEIRVKETSIANFFADLIKSEFKCDIGVINTGTIRADEYYSPGPLTYQTIQKMFAIPDLLVVVRISGLHLHEMLENGVSKWPSYDGRFLGVSSVRFKFDASLPPQHRILKQNISINGEPIDYNKIYTMATKNFIATGKDGFRVVPESDFIVSSTAGISVLQTVINFFETVRKSDFIRKLSSQIEDEDEKTEIILQQNGYEERYKKFAHIVKTVRHYDDEPYIVIAPQVDGRITND